MALSTLLFFLLFGLTWSNTGSTIDKVLERPVWSLIIYAIPFGAANSTRITYNTFRTHVPKHVHALLLTAVTDLSSSGGLAEQAPA